MATSRNDRVALADVVLDPLPVDRDVALEEVHSRVVDQGAEAIGGHVHSIDLPVGRLEQAPRQVMADEAVDAEDEDSFHEQVV